MAGVTLRGQTYFNPETGRYGTAKEHAAYQNQRRYQEPFNAAAPSAGAANATASVANPNLDYTVDPTGNLAYNNSSAQARRQAELNASLATTATTAQTKAARDAAEQAARLQAEAETRRVNTLKGLFGGMFPGPGGVPGPLPGGPSAPGINPQEQAVRDVAFARAKDKTGNLASAQLRGLEGSMAGRGISGSPIDILGQAQVLGGARGGLDELASEQMIQDLNRGAQVSDLQYQGDITKRGQDLSYLTAQRNALLGLFGQLF